jgi:predicted dienelactone hydrolase
MAYDPFRPGDCPVSARTIERVDAARARGFKIEIWGSGAGPSIVFSHHSGGHRRAATYLCEHLASHGYVVAALDHSESFVPELARVAGESAEQRAARIEALIGSRVPDLRFLLDAVPAERVGALGHSFGGWTVLAAAQDDPRIQSVVALAPGGAANAKPGILPLRLTFQREVPALFIAAENDVSLPLEGMCELFGRAPQPKRLLVLRRADHLHFIDEVAKEHEKVRAMQFPPPLDWISREMRPYAELCPEETAHRFIRGLALAHFDATLRGNQAARDFLATGAAAPGVDSFEV